MRSSSPHRRRLLLGAIAAVGVALLAVGASALLRTPASDAAAPVDLQGNVVTADPGLHPDASPPETTPTDDRLRVPSAGLDVALSELTPTGGEITPPGFTEAYLVRDLGVLPAAAREGTMIVVMHSLRGGGVGPGNHLIDVEKGTARVDKGARVTVAGVDYTVTGSAHIAKAELSRRAAVWNDEPGRLELITCLQKPDGTPSTDNVVITATLAD